MARAINKLTVRAVQTTTAPGRYSDGQGVYLTVDGSGRKRFVLRYSFEGKVRELGLGSAADVGLAEVRRKAQDARERVRAGEDPVAARKAASKPAVAAGLTVQTLTFGKLADDFIETMSPSWRNPKHAAQWTMTLREYAASLRELRLDQVDTDAVVAVLTPIWHRIPDTASRLRGRIEAVLASAIARKLMPGPNPAAWKNHLEFILPRPKKLGRGHHRAMPYAEVPAFVARLRTVGKSSANALEFAILTAARSGEVLGAHWSEIDLGAKLWTVPAVRMKGGRSHRVPLSDRALAILASMATLRQPGDSHVFPGAKRGSGLSAMALEMALRRLGSDVTPHGFRSSLRDWVGEETSFPREVAEAALAHQVGDSVELAYRRGDALAKRRELMEAWAAYLDTLPITRV